METKEIEVQLAFTPELQEALEKSGDSLYVFLHKAIEARISFVLKKNEEAAFTATRKIKKAIAAVIAYNEVVDQGDKIFITQNVVHMLTSCNTGAIKKVFLDPEVSSRLKEHHKAHSLSVKDNSNKSGTLRKFLKERISID